MRVVVLGGAGMLGHKVVQRLAETTPDLWWTLRGDVNDSALSPLPVLRGDHALQHVDAMDFERLEGVLRDLRPDAVVNCLGVIKQRADASVESTCLAINALLPHRVAKTLSSWGGRLIHMSTDCVFSGTKGSYTEDDVPDATDIYGRTKAAGEVRTENAITLRTSLIGRELRHHRSLLDWFLSQQGRRVQGYRRVTWSGVTTPHLAAIVEMLLLKHRALAGVYHVSSGSISKYDLLRELRRAYGLDVEIEPDDTMCRDLSLVGSRFDSATGYRCPSWRVLLDELVADRTPYPELTGSSW